MSVSCQINQGDSLPILKNMPNKSVHCCITSPPYWGLRDYGVEGQLGLEKTPEEYVTKMVELFREVRRVLRDDGTLFLNLGDSYYGSGKGRNADGSHSEGGKQETNRGAIEGKLFKTISGVQRGDVCDISGKGPEDYQEGKIQLKPKDLVGIPWRVAFALQADGWYLRSDIIWCLSGGAYLYVKSQKGAMPMMVRDMARLEPSTIKLWNGTQWTSVLGISKSGRRGDELEIVLRSGERIGCTPTHKFPTNRGLVDASSLKIGDMLETCTLPDVENPRDCAIDEDAAWFAGLYIAEGSQSGNTIQIAGHSKEIERWNRINKIVAKYGGSCTRTIDGNQMNIRVYGKVLKAIIDELVTGKTAKDKGFSPSVWKYSNKFISSMLDGYLSGDGHFEANNNRWRLGFTRNYNLERDLRTACARLGYHLILNTSTVKYDGKYVPTFRGELRKERSGHHNEKSSGEIVEIRKARCREVYYIGVENEPHLFALASGVLTHNSKPNPMPESVTDRPTKAHEYIFLLSKNQKYYYDHEAIKEPSVRAGQFAKSGGNTEGMGFGYDGNRTRVGLQLGAVVGNTRNKHTVWTVATKPFSGVKFLCDYVGSDGKHYKASPNCPIHGQLINGNIAKCTCQVITIDHFATFPPKLIEPCILAGTSPQSCEACGAPWERVIKREGMTSREWPSVGWRPTCKCQNNGSGKCVVLDPFSGSGTTGLVALRHGRQYIGIELNPKYVEMSKHRISDDAPLFYGADRMD